MDSEFQLPSCNFQVFYFLLFSQRAKILLIDHKKEKSPKKFIFSDASNLYRICFLLFIYYSIYIDNLKMEKMGV
jgi:hypothetical protein